MATGNVHRVLFAMLSGMFLLRQAVETTKCDLRCLNTEGRVQNCALNRPSHLLREKQAISQLQCFDACLRQPGCEMYNFRQQLNSCQLFRGFWSFDDETSLFAEKGTVFSWIRRDIYSGWLQQKCLQTDVCQVSNSPVKEFCKKPLDVGFLLDTSKENLGELNMTTRFIAKVLQTFELSSQLTKVGIVEYHTEARVTFSFNNFTSPDHFARYLTTIQNVNGKTRYDKSLHQAESVLFSAQGGARPFVHRVVVLITDNDLDKNIDSNLLILKQSLVKKCIQTFAVGIEAGKVVAARVVDSQQSHLLQVDLPRDLEAQAQNFAKKICAALG